MEQPHDTKNNVLLVNITRLGDMLQATPTIAGMKEENPNCRITVLVEKQFEEVCKVLPDIDEVISLDLTTTVRALARQADGIIEAYEYVDEVVKDLRRREFDFCLNMSSSAYTALLLRLAGVKRNGGWTSDGEGNRVIESGWARLFATSVFHQNREYNSFNLVDVFRRSAQVSKHPRKLLMKVEEDARLYVDRLIQQAGFTNTGPLICIQAGASQAKRQWATENFVRLITALTRDHNARVVLSGSKKELAIIGPIAQQCSDNVLVAAGRTNIPQLAALLSVSDLLITGDTGPMHISVAVDTPVVSLFLASAYGFETGPYSEGNIIIQPVIGCGPCNPNKPCSQPDCHDHISPELVTFLSMQRLNGIVEKLPAEGSKRFIDPSKVIVYQSYFDEFGFCDLRPLSDDRYDEYAYLRRSYRRLWMDELEGKKYTRQNTFNAPFTIVELDRPLRGGASLEEGITLLSDLGTRGEELINELVALIRNVSAPVESMAQVNLELTELDRRIEQIGFHYSQLSPISRMFLFDKENLRGSNALELASQMKEVYGALLRRSRKFRDYLLN